jgi:hypothetical protein
MNVWFEVKAIENTPKHKNSFLKNARDQKMSRLTVAPQRAISEKKRDRS